MQIFIHISSVHFFVKYKLANIIEKCLYTIFLVPPKHPRIIDETGREVAPGTSVGPYMEGDTVVLKCITLEGNLIYFEQLEIIGTEKNIYFVHYYLCLPFRRSYSTGNVVEG